MDRQAGIEEASTVPFVHRQPHQLGDVYRTLHGPTPASMPVSHDQRGTSRRYDHVLASPEFTLAAVDYLFDDRVRALSDHALTSVTLEL